MSQTTPPTVDALPTAPNTSVPTGFAATMDTFLAALATFRTQVAALGVNIYNNCVDAFNSAVAAAASASSAASSAAAAATASGVTIWVSGTTYAIGDCRFSPINSGTYRRKTAGAGTTDPSADATNWGLISAGNACTAAEIKAGTEAMKQIAPAGLLAAIGLSAYMQTADQTITLSGALTIAHGLGRAPILIHAFIKNTSAEANYSVGDIIPVNIAAESFGTTNFDGATLTFDATNVYVRFAASMYLISDKSTGAATFATAAKWSYFLRVHA